MSFIFPLKKWDFLLVFIISFLFSACNFPLQPEPIPVIATPVRLTGGDIYPVDAIFLDFYNALGGETVLGLAITPLLDAGIIKTQYVENGLMVYDPQATDIQRHKLAPLGVMLGVAEPAIPDPGLPEVRYIDGHVIYEEFVPIYERLGGAQYVGRPLTEARYNPEKQRIEQHFENLGFFRLDADPPGEVRLLAYGVIACNQRCRYQAPSASIPTLRPLLPEPFASKAARLGLSVTGRTLSEPYLAVDGKLEVIFENLVLVVEPAESEQEDLFLSIQLWFPIIFNSWQEPEARQEGFSFKLYLPLVVVVNEESEEVQLDFRRWLPLFVRTISPEQPKVVLRPIVEMIGIEADPPVSHQIDPLMVFYPTEGELGYHVPVFFHDYLQRYGGVEVFGPPVSEVSPVNNGIFRQCFTNMCLDFDLNAPAGQRLKPAPLGITYKDLFFGTTTRFAEDQSLEGVQMQVWEAKPFVSSNDIQQIHVLLYQGNKPLVQREPVLTLTMPDGSQQTYSFPPTDENGRTYLIIPPISAPNGTLIAYQVCLAALNDDQICVGDNYLIWNY